MRAINLKCEQLTNPVGIDVLAPVLSWKCEGGSLQKAYLVEARRQGEEAPFFSTGKVESSAMQVKLPEGLLSSRDQVTWSVTLWDEEDVQGEAKEATFEIGLTKKEDWQARWINVEQPHPEEERQRATYVKRTFQVEKVGKARLYITCHGLYKAFLNSNPIGEEVLTPGVDDYRKRLQVQTYDVTNLLKEGNNELQMVLGDGWYRGNNGVDGLFNYYGKDQSLLLQLEVEGQVALTSDQEFLASKEGPIGLNDMEKGESYDARKEGIFAPESEASFYPVTLMEEETGNFDKALLCASNSVPMRQKERFAGKLLTTPNGERVLDFGQNLAGVVSFKLEAHEGDTITLWHGETLDENGNFTQKNYDPGDRNKNGGIPQRIDYICKEGLNEYTPSFTLFGFRYAKIETNIDLTKAEFTAVAVYSDMEETASFTCGNEDVNRLFKNCLWSMKSNFADIPTDCPTRERAGWTGDAGAFTPTGRYLMNCYPVLRKWLSECRLAQGEDGLVANIAPVNNAGGFISNMLQGSAGWSDAVVLVPWALYEATGDITILEENYDMMKRFLSFVEKRAQKTRLWNRKNPYRKYLVDEGFHFGEWCEPDVDNMATMKKTMTHGAPEVATAYYYRSSFLVSKIASLLGKEEDAAKYQEIAENAKNAYRFTCTKNGKIRSERQAEYVRPVALGLLEGDEAKEAVKELALNIAHHGNHLNTGFLSTPFLCRVLSDYGFTTTAYSLLLQDTNPSWLYAVKHGATTIWETWDGVKETGEPHDSLNHYSYGSIAGFLMDTALGIRLETLPEYFTITPHPDERLGHAEGSYQSAFGKVSVSWRYEEDHLRYEIEIPYNGKARILLPDGTEEIVGAGKHTYHTAL